MADAAAIVAGAGDAGGGAGGTPPASGDWTPPEWAVGLEPDVLSMPKLREWKSPADAVRAYHGVQKLIGADPANVLTVPKADDAAGWDALYTKLGRPATGKDYEIPMPEKGGDEGFAEWFRGIAHQNGLTKAQAKGLVEAWNAQVGERMGQLDAGNAEKAAAAKAELTKAWGPDDSEGFKNNAAVAARAARQFGLADADIDGLEKALGLTRTMTLLHDLGAKLGEPNYEGGNGGDGFTGGQMTAEQAQQKVQEFLAEGDNRAAWQDNQHPKHKEVMARITSIFTSTYGSE